MSSQQQQQQSGGDNTDQQTPDARFMDLYSRQIGTYGMDTMMKLTSLKVLICGLKGTGAETAKNLALAGVHTIALYDPEPPTIADLGVNFALTEQCLGKADSRAQVTSRLISELNPNTRVKAVTDISDSAIATYDSVIITSAHNNLAFSELNRINAICHAKKASFVLCISGGPVASIFVDNGEGFVTKDPDGRAPLQKSIVEVKEKVDKKNRSYTRIRFETPDGMIPGALRDRTEVLFSEVKGLKRSDGTSINNVKTPFEGFVALSDAKNTVRIYPSLKEQGYSEYETGGFIHEQKERVTRNFATLAEAIKNPPEFIMTHAAMDLSNESSTHACLHALLRFAEKNGGRFPGLRDAAHASQLFSIAQQVSAEGKEAQENAKPVEAQAPTEEDPNEERPYPPPPPRPPGPFTHEVPEAFAKRVANLISVELQPVAAILGAIVGQEIVKATGKYTPIHQFLHFANFEALPENDEGLDVVPKGNRYDNLNCIYGSAFVKQLNNLKMFMVGCGALGCELIKNYALCGICCGADGKFTVTDNDRIEVSNLNRQFLFREDNVGQPKSVAAAQRARMMNKAMNIDSHQHLVGDKSEHIYTDEFWMGLDCVTNALDNMTARLYVDRQCVLYSKPLLESGTTGTGGNVDIVVPYKTKSYSDGGNADETGGIPMCTLRNFPYIFDHCIEWSRAQFDDHFVAPMLASSQLREDPAGYVKKLKTEVFEAQSLGTKRSLLSKNTRACEELLAITEVLLKGDAVTMSDCVSLAWNLFHVQFRDRIQSLVTNFPKDIKNKKGELFWGGNKKFPTVLNANLDVQDVVDFLISASNLFASMLGFHGEKHPPVKNDPKNRWKSEYRSAEWIRSEISKLAVPPPAAMKMEDLDEDMKATAEANNASATAELSDEEEERKFLALLDELAQRGPKLSAKAQPLDFEKDDDDNFHIDFVTACSNLRATNYDIQTADRLKVKLVAGKIIPAIATTTAAVTGFILLEYFKFLLGKKIEDFRNGQIDLGGNSYVMFEPMPPIENTKKVIKTYDPVTDYTDERTIYAAPSGFTKYDKLEFEVTPATTIEEFGDMVLAHPDLTGEKAENTPYSIGAIGAGQGMMWNGLPKHSNAKKSLMATIVKFATPELAVQEDVDATQEQIDAFWNGKLIYSKLAINIDSDDGDEVIIPTCVLRIKRA